MCLRIKGYYVGGFVWVFICGSEFGIYLLWCFLVGVDSVVSLGLLLLLWWVEVGGVRRG